MHISQKKYLHSLILFLVVCFVYGCAEKQELEITKVALSSVNLHQGDEFTLDVTISATRRFDNLTASFQVEDESGQILAQLESDFFIARPSTKKTVSFNFRWADLDTHRTGKMRITHALLKQYPDNKTFHTLTNYNKTLPFQVIPVEDEVQRMFVSRENSLWWLTEMGRVDNVMTRRNGLSGCVMFGGYPETWIRNDHLVSEGTDGLCYWEITGYTVRQFALEYERTGNSRFLEMAQQSANSIIRYIRDDQKAPLLMGSLPAFIHYDARPAEWYQDKTMLFDHGQVLMGLLELVRVMEKVDSPVKDLEAYQDAAKRVGGFMLRASEYNDGKIPSYLTNDTVESSADTEETTKVVIGFNLLHQLTKDKKVRQTALNHLNQVRDNSAPYRGDDHHGRSYTAYGFIRGFEDYLEPGYLQKAEQWLEHIALDMNKHGLLVPEENYSAIPAQNQLIRNASLLWKLTADPRYLQWAERSAQYLTRSDEAWTYRQPILKLGRFYREAGGLFNNIEDNEVCSWASIFHIDAMYHYLSLTYGHIYLGRNKVISMIGPVKVERIANGVVMLLRGSPDENIGIYVDKQAPIKSIEIDGQQFPYYSEHTARLPSFKGLKHVRILFGRDKNAHIKQTNSHIMKAELNNTALSIQLLGKAKTKGVMQIYWPDRMPTILSNGKTVAKSAWSWDPASGVLIINYTHNGKEQTLKIMPTH